MFKNWQQSFINENDYKIWSYSYFNVYTNITEPFISVENTRTKEVFGRETETPKELLKEIKKEIKKCCGKSIKQLNLF